MKPITGWSLIPIKEAYKPMPYIDAGLDGSQEIGSILFSKNIVFKHNTVERSLLKNGVPIDGILVDNIKQLLDVLVTYDTIGWHLKERTIQATMLGNESQSFVIEFKEDFSILNKKENQVTISYKQFKDLNIN